MILRLAREEDREAINRLAQQVHELHVAWRPDIFRSSAEIYNEKGFSKFFQEQALFVAEQDGKVAAYVQISLREIDHRLLKPRKVLYVDELCVEEHFRHQGLGRQIMQDLRQIARDRGCTDLELSAFPQNETAVHLYESFGFAVKHIDYQMKI